MGGGRRGRRDRDDLEHAQGAGLRYRSGSIFELLGEVGVVPDLEGADQYQLF